MKSNWYGLFIIILLLLSAQISTSQKPSRIKVRRSSSSSAAGVGNLSSKSRNNSYQFESKQLRDNELRSEGKYIDVDLTTLGFHTTFFVTNTEDSGTGSFRKAIEDANASPGLDIINFSIGSGVQSITPLSQLPSITSPVTIDGTTQPGYIGKPLIELVGSNVGVGLNILAGNSTVRGLVINRCHSTGIVLDGGGSNVIESNYIGTNVAGDGSLTNFGNGVYILNSPNNRIGDTTSVARNIISGNAQPNVAIAGAASVSNVVYGNYIGIDVTGLIDISFSATSNGVVVRNGATHNLIGGTQLGARNIISGNNWPGIAFSDPLTSDNVVQGNFIGTDWFGYSALGNQKGVVITAGASNNIIGDTSIAGGNLISGNDSSGVAIDGLETTNNVVMGNIIGTRAPNEGYGFGIGNLTGVLIYNSPGNTVGGAIRGAGNFITANFEDGIVIKGSQATGNHVQGNSIGAGRIAITGLGNNRYGVFINNAPDNTVGGADSLAGNYIGSNFSHGVVIEGINATGNRVEGNHIGTDGVQNLGNNGNGILLIASQDTIGGQGILLGNTIAYNIGSGVFDSISAGSFIRYNSIYSNVGLGIDLAPHGLTPNDSLDADTGANNLQNFPILDSAIVGVNSIRIRGKLNSQPNAIYTIDFFKNDTRNLSHFGEGQTFIGTIFDTCDVSGRGNITVTLPVAVRTDQFITATATGPDGSTSEFSRALCLLDSDGDGIMDCWESEGDGIDVNADGIIDLDLYAKGARPDHKDIFVEVDYMFGFQPGDSVLPLVQSAFAKIKNKYVNNPDHNDGINLFTELNPNDLPIQDSTWTSDSWKKFFAAKKQFFGTDAERADPNAANILEAKRLVYRYCIFANRHDTAGSSGVAELNDGAGGNDFMVTLGAFNPVSVGLQAGTFMHELGHTLGLHHGGADDKNYKPNYYSVMNYAWQAPQFTTYYGGLGWTLNYSPVALPTLNEASLVESIGLGAKPNDFPTVIFPYNGPGNVTKIGVLHTGTAVDWDGNGDSTGNAVATVDLNFLDQRDPGWATPGDVLISYADWPNLKYNFRLSSEFRDPTAMELRAKSIQALVQPDEMTKEIYDSFQKFPPYGIVAPLSVWSTDPNENIPISTAPLNQGGQVIASDGAGGAFIAWLHNARASSLSGVYAQLIDTLGGVQWKNNGVPVSGVLNKPDLCTITSDDAGGAIIVWEDHRDARYNLYAQRINRFGQLLWGANGVPVTSIPNEQAYLWPVVTKDQQHGAIVVWQDRHSGTPSLYAQRINGSGIVQWDASGVLISTSPMPANGENYRVTGDNAGGVIIALEDQRNGVANRDIYAQRVDSAGAVQWTLDGVAICAATGVQVYPVIAGDGAGGGVVSWEDFRDGSADIYAQRINSTGVVQWTLDGVPVATGTGAKTLPEVTANGSGGAIIAWNDYRRNSNSDRDVYAQRIDASGTARWMTDGVAVADTVRTSYRLVLVNDNTGGAIIIYSHDTGFTLADLYAQRIDSSGNLRWKDNGVIVCDAAGAQGLPVAINDNAGGAIIAWQDDRTDPAHDNFHIYAQNITGDGAIGGGIVTSVAPTHPTIVTEFKLMQNYPNPFNPSTTIKFRLPVMSNVTVRIYNVLGQLVKELTNGIKTAGEHSVVWNTSSIASGVYFCRFEAFGTTNAKQSFTQVRKMILLK